MSESESTPASSTEEDHGRTPEAATEVQPQHLVDTEDKGMLSPGDLVDRQEFTRRDEDGQTFTA